MRVGHLFILFDAAALAAAYGLGFLSAEQARLWLDLQLGEYGLYDAPRARLITFLAVSLGLVAWLSLARGHHARRMPFWETLRDLTAAVFFAALCDAALMYMQKLPFARLSWAFTWLSALCLLPIGRKALVAALSRRGFWRCPVLLVGNGETGRSAWLALESDAFLGYAVDLVYCPNASGAEGPLGELAAARKMPVATDAGAVERWIQQGGPSRIVVAIEPEKIADYSRAIQALSILDPELIVIPPLRGLPLYGTEPMYFFRHEVLLLRLRNNLGRWAPMLAKRSFDLAGASFGLLLAAPFFLWTMLRIRADGGPAIFSHSRVGRGGKTFACYKFRTMVVDSDRVLRELLDRDAEARAAWQRDFKLRDDPRVTPIGRFLRRTSLDELPQLFNVIRGEMSLVGPRPIIEQEVARYGDSARFYFEARPGITGLWQVSGRNDIDYEQRVALDTWYVRNWSLWNDLVIIAKTVPVVLRKDGAY